MAEWNGRKPVTLLLGISQIVADHEFQSRAAMSVADMKEFSEAMLRAETYEFPAVVVFEVKPGCYMLADGFHRHGAAKAAMAINPNFRNIKCDVYQGTVEDVRVYSAGANQKFSIKRTADCLKKSVWMLLGVESWRTKSVTMISKHIGCSRDSADRSMTEYFDHMKIQRPHLVEQSDGRTVPARKTRPLPSNRGETPKIYECKKTGKRTIGFHAKQIYLGTDSEKAEAKVEEELKRIKKKKAILSDRGNLLALLTRRGFLFSATSDNSHRVAGLMGIRGHGFIVVPEPMDFPEQAVLAVGRAVLLNQQYCGNNRMVVLSYPEFCPEKVVELAKLAGVEFLTPEELVVSLGGKAEPTEDEDAA